jgi:hypothetical protein
MSQRFMDVGQTVGYDFADKKLIVTVSEKTAQKMKADGWTVGHEEELGYFVSVKLLDEDAPTTP